MNGERKMKKYVAIVIAALTVITVFSALFTMLPNGKSMVSQNAPTSTNPELEKAIKKITAGPKISPVLENVMKNTQKDKKIWVYVITNDPVKLGNYMRSIGIKTKIGTKNYNIKYMPSLRALVLRLTPEQITQLSKSPYALKIFNHPSAKIQMTNKDRLALTDGKVGNVLNPLNFKNRGIYQTLHHHAQEAWMEGFMGSNVTISIVDTGVDFAQPNLYGSWAVENNPNSPYYGWPMVYDSWSAYLYMAYNLTGMDAYNTIGIPSWYVNTSYNTTALPNGTVYFNGHYYNVSGIPSASGHYHLGLLPEVYNYLKYFGAVPAVLVTDSKTNYTYDTVYVDLNMNYDFTDEKPTNKTSPVSYRDDYNATSKTTSKMWNGGDGYPDWSGGMIYFIADGNHTIPGVDFLAGFYGISPPVPGKGDIVAFEGDFDDYPHGTACAANAASRGVTLNGAGIGMAPQAKIIAEPHFWFDAGTEWYFAQLGYDFSIGGGAQISSNSWGSSNIHWDGWDSTEDRYLDYVVQFLYLDYGIPPTTSFLVALGNGGPGYGTATSPAVQSAISVGAGSEWGYRQIMYGDSTLYDSYYGDVVDFSARGPFSNGKATPDILATGEFGITPYALDYYVSGGGVGNGAMHFDLFSGTSMATPVAAGGLALIYDAYYKTYGTYPDIYTAKHLLLSAADDHNYDPLSQGAGWLNVSRAIDMITGKGGIGVSPNIWNVGSYEGHEYPMFAGIMYPGQSVSKTIHLTNYNWSAASSANVQISSAIYKIAYEKNITLSFSLGNVSNASTWKDVSQWVNLSSLGIPSNIDLMQVMAYTNYTSLDDPNDTHHQNPNISYNIAYLWDYINYTAIDNYTDRMRMQVSAGQGNTIDVMFHDPMKRVHGDMWYQLRVIRLKDVQIDFHVKVVGYRAVSWNWLAFSASSLTISGNNGTAGVTATVTVPNNAKPGVYEGKILINDGTHLSSVPVVVFVAAQINSLSDVITIGGENLSQYNTYLYENSHVRGLYDWMWRAEAGDWRFFFLNITNNVNVNNAYLTVDISWENNLTDIDGFILGNTTDDWSTNYSANFGPYTEHVVGQSKNMYLGAGMYAWYTSTGGPREIISAPMQNGLMEIMLHNVLYAGASASEKFTIKVYVTTYSPQSMNINVGEVTGLNGTRTVTFTTYSATSALDVRITPMVYLDQQTGIPISTGEDKYFIYNTVGWKYLAIRATSIHPDTDDIDLYVYYSDDGYHFYLFGYSATDSGDEYVDVGDPSAHPYWLAKVNGYSVEEGCTFTLTTYEGLPNIPQVNVSNLPTSINPGVPATFNINYNFSGYSIEAGTYMTTVYFGPNGSKGVYPVHLQFNALDQRKPSVIPMTTGVIGNSQPTLVVAWNDTGVIWSPPKNATWWIDGIMIPAIRTEISGGYLYAAVPFLLADGPHEVRVYYEDGGGNGNTTTWTFTVDATAPTLTITSPENGNVPITYDSTLWINGTTDPDANVTINGVSVPVDSNGNFAYKATLVEGQNVFVVEAKDSAGNVAKETVTALYMPELPELWNRINSLNSQIVHIQDEISSINTQLSSMNAQISSMQAQLNNLSAQLSELKTALDENVTALNNAIENTRTDLIHMINENITSINTQINNISAQVDKIKQEVGDIQEKNKAQDSSIGMNAMLGYAGIALAILAIIIALGALLKKGNKGGAETPESAPTEEANSEEDLTKENEEEALEEI